MTPGGQTEHPSHACPNSKERSLDTGDKKRGRNEKTQEAVKNALEEELIGEMCSMII